MTKQLTIQESARKQTAATAYTSTFDVSYFVEMILTLAITAQGTYTDETLDVTIQGQDPLGNWFTLAQFTQVGNVVSSVPYTEALKLNNFGGKIRAKIVTAGTAVDFTMSLSGYAKRYGV